MKKILTLCLSLLVGSLSLCAQSSDTVDDVFQFVDAEGNVIPDGSRITRNLLEDYPLGGYVINSGVFLTASSQAFLHLEATTKSMVDGSGSICYPQNCYYFNVGETIKTDTKLGSKTMNDNIMCEFFPLGENSSCEVEIQVFRHDITLSNGVPTPSETAYPGSKITIFFTADQTAGISDAATVESSKEVARYTLDGQKLAAPQKGINIVKYADGRTVKVVVK